ncbi:ABC transporter permease [Paenibacillus pabuli]|uniref:ABC transporter permease n=1 Tax=Paenibacillus pabuli TaxID=1472 RepID=UPI0009E70B22|nr:ABC transporter permease [Paenibacillus pabuli]MEC0126126.1 ABC transporter permease [Paenibacillus pabuli]
MSFATTYFRILSAERLKMIKSPVWLLILLSPLIALLIGLLSTPSGDWRVLMTTMVFLHGLLLLPILTGVFTSFVCRFEHAGGGWKQMLVLPLTRTGVYAGKLTIVLLLLVGTQLLLLGSILLAGQLQGITAPVPWGFLAEKLLLGLFACLPLTALQMFVSLVWSSFAAPLALNFALTVPNILIVNSVTFGPYYPWAQPMILMTPMEGEGFGAYNVPLETMLAVVGGSAVLFMLIGVIYFRKKEI